MVVQALVWRCACAAVGPKRGSRERGPVVEILGAGFSDKGGAQPKRLNCLSAGG